MANPQETTTQALQALPFSSLIGGPLEACIQAQSQAAMSTLDFITTAGMQYNENTGKYETIEVTFSYQKAGQDVELTVPLLTIVPIPYISINQINIDFTANMSASSSTVQEKTKETEAGGEASAGLQAGWGPYSAHADLKANYSSKKSSRASQESKYSIEYTMNVNVSAGQASMPAGLQSVLNILQEAITESEATESGSLALSMPAQSLNLAALTTTTYEVTALDSSNNGIDGQSIDYAFDISDLPSDVTVTINSGTGVAGGGGNLTQIIEGTADTDGDGKLDIGIAFAKTTANGPDVDMEELRLKLTVSSTFENHSIPDATLSDDGILTVYGTLS